MEEVDEMKKQEGSGKNIEIVCVGNVLYLFHLYKTYTMKKKKLPWRCISFLF